MMRAWARLLVVAGVMLHAVAGPWVRPAPIPTRPRIGARIVSWNLRNFPEPGEDFDRIRTTVDRLDADVWVLQEVRDPGRLRAIWPHARIDVSDGGGRGGQHLAIVVVPGRAVPIGEVHEWSGLTAGGRVRPALASTLMTREGPLDLAVVHLKSRREGAALRRRQWSQLADALGPDAGRPRLVVGDFNVAGGPASSAADEHADLDAAMADLGLRRLLDVGQCTSYWEGVRRDHWWVGSGLDAAYLSTDGPIATAWIGGTCARHRCDPIHNPPSHPDLDLTDVSDHCPVVIDLIRGPTPRRN